ncbi:hypothetical protein ACJW31_03G077500 [Castanea mollissima]
MALTSKLESELEFKSSADKVYSIVSSQNYHVANASDTVHEVDIHEGDWQTTGSVKLWKYTVEGNVETLKEKVEIDEANKKVTLTALEGHCLDLYRTYKVIFQVVPKSEGGSVKVTIEYEKLNENVPPPTKYIDFIVNLFKDIDAHALKA